MVICPNTRTLKDSSKRSKGPGYKIQCRRDGRVKEKMIRRLNALDNVEDWSERIKEKIGAVVGSRDYNSSEESNVEQDENGKDLKVFKVKRLPWESNKLRRTKEVLDEVHRGQNKGGVQVVRKRHHNLSNRLMPQNAPSWAVLASSTPRVK